MGIWEAFTDEDGYKCYRLSDSLTSRNTELTEIVKFPIRPERRARSASKSVGPAAGKDLNSKRSEKIHFAAKHVRSDRFSISRSFGIVVDANAKSKRSVLKRHEAGTFRFTINDGKESWRRNIGSLKGTNNFMNGANLCPPPSASLKNNVMSTNSFQDRNSACSEKSSHIFSSPKSVNQVIPMNSLHPIRLILKPSSEAMPLSDSHNCTELKEESYTDQPQLTDELDVE